MPAPRTAPNARCSNTRRPGSCSNRRWCTTRSWCAAARRGCAAVRSTRSCSCRCCCGSSTKPTRRPCCGSPTALQRLGNDSGLAWLDAAIAIADTAERAGQLALEALAARNIELGDSPTWERIRAELQRLHGEWRKRGTPSLATIPAPDAAQLESRLAAHLITPEGWQLRPVDDARWVMRHTGVLAVPMLARALATDQHYIRTMPLQVLAELGPVGLGAADAILPLLGDPLSQAYAVRALGEIGARQHLPFLRPLLQHRDSELRTATAIALGLLRDEASRGALQQAMVQADETLDVRVGAAFALRCFGENAPAEAFLAERASKGDYHEPVLNRLRERLAALDAAAASGR